MKRYLFLFALLILTFTSCTVESDDRPQFYLEVLPIDSVEMPEQFVHGETYEIWITYTRPTLCYEFNDFFYEIDGHERTVAIINTVYTNFDCVEESEQITVRMEFPVTGTDTYVFKFYQGQDENEVDQYYLVEVPVVQ